MKHKNFENKERYRNKKKFEIIKELTERKISGKSLTKIYKDADDPVEAMESIDNIENWSF